MASLLMSVIASPLKVKGVVVPLKKGIWQPWKSSASSLAFCNYLNGPCLHQTYNVMGLKPLHDKCQFQHSWKLMLPFYWLWHGKCWKNLFSFSSGWAGSWKSNKTKLLVERAWFILKICIFFLRKLKILRCSVLFFENSGHLVMLFIFLEKKKKKGWFAGAEILRKVTAFLLTFLWFYNDCSS